MAISAQHLKEIIYPDSDGKPMAENTEQYDYLTMIKTGLAAQFKNENVFVAGDLLWYPVQGRPDITVAPDVLVAFGRPPGRRSSYKQWEEGNVAPQVVFEILSPGNTRRELQAKRTFYQRHGVEEYYEYDPDNGTLDCWRRVGDFFTYLSIDDEWTSPRLGIKLRLEANGALSVFYPNGRKFELTEDEILRANAAELRAERFAAKLRELGIEPE
ncbi:MAG: Uma2 family endonuclease [Acidobacteria bacterium]|nr:Uma2 family endonuclease [Acidobacteriota bacterium]